jgi:hypothetical protein
VDVRVGTYKLDNTHRCAATITCQRFHATSLPIDDDSGAIRSVAARDARQYQRAEDPFA